MKQDKSDASRGEGGHRISFIKTRWVEVFFDARPGFSGRDAVKSPEASNLIWAIRVNAPSVHRHARGAFTQRTRMICHKLVILCLSSFKSECEPDS